MAKRKVGLLPRLIAGIILGIIIGLISRSIQVYFLVRVLSTFTSIFGNFLKFIIPLIIIGFVAPGIADLGKGAGKLLGITAGIAYISTIIAGTAAFFLGSTILPNIIKAGEMAQKSAVKIEPYFTIEMPPIMGVMTALIFAFILGLGMANIKGKTLFETLKDFQNIIEGVVRRILIPFIPIHISGISAKLAATNEMFKTIKAFSAVFILIIILQISYIIIQYLVAWLVSGKGPFKSIKNMLPAYFTALGTQSSAATIPVTIQCARKNGISEDVIDFVIPLGATIHLAGDTITLVLASMGLMMISGTIPTLGMMFPFILMLGVTMVAAPGIPGGGVYAALGLLENMLGFTAAQQGLMIAIHFSQDSFGTATNVTGDGAIALIIDKIAKNSKLNKGI
ncbi:sodium:proton antiporter [Caloranaerobacter azorensis H53214]|uniref:Sodium:proton antiporter n=1 Tax=Caloranaerobacter azorensis H53214 TaxID=1156417 RepID=A0A096BGP9_9FIRM|nr:dicarboxylate/amino acid:cation symporter [Caloranaerobacter azorensis]KGG79938.1 sodium:proton antiporter [Caloranaerobacter azorensis H53214]